MAELSKQDFEAVRTKPPAPRNMQPPKPPPKPMTEAEKNRVLWQENYRLKRLLRDGGFYLNAATGKYYMVKVEEYDVSKFKFADPKKDSE